VQYQKIRHHTTKSRRKAQKKLLQFSKRNINQLKQAVEHLKENMQNASNLALKSLSKAKEQFLEKAENFLDTACAIIAQQKDIYKHLFYKRKNSLYTKTIY